LDEHGRPAASTRPALRGPRGRGRREADGQLRRPRPRRRGSVGRKEADCRSARRPAGSGLRAVVADVVSAFDKASRPGPPGPRSRCCPWCRRPRTRFCTPSLAVPVVSSRHHDLAGRAPGSSSPNGSAYREHNAVASRSRRWPTAARDGNEQLGDQRQMCQDRRGGRWPGIAGLVASSASRPDVDRAGTASRSVFSGQPKRTIPRLYSHFGALARPGICLKFGGQ